jgi:uncharacterized protein
MAMRERLSESMKAAMKAKDAKRLSTVRLMLAAIQQQDIATRQTITDDEVLTVLARMIKQREESAATYDQGRRPELAQGEREEIVIIREFMPQQLGADQITAAVKETIASVGASSMKDMGKVMAALKAKVQGRADLGAVSARIKQRLG